MGLVSRFRMLFRMKANAALDRVEQPGQVVDYAFAQQQELLRQVKQGLIEVATAKRRLERQSSEAQRTGARSRRSNHEGAGGWPRRSRPPRPPAAAGRNGRDQVFAGSSWRGPVGGGPSFGY